MTSRTNRFLIFALWLCGLAAAAQFGKISVTFDLLQARYGGGIALMVSVVGLMGLIFGTTSGLIVQRLAYHRVLIGALATGAVMSALQALSLPYALMMASRVIEGLTHLGIVVCAPVMIARAAEPRHMGAAMSLWSSFFGVSFALTAWAGLPLATAYGPAGLFLVHAGIMAALAILMIRMAPRFAPVITPIGNLITRHVEIYRSPFIAAPALGFVFYTAMYVAVLTILPLMVTGWQRPWLASGMPLVSIVVSLTVGVWLLRHFDPVRLVQTGFAVALAAGIWIWLAQDGTLIVPAYLLAGATGLVQGSSFASIPRLNASDDDRAKAAGAIAQMGNLGTTTGTPILAAMTHAFGFTGVLAFVLPLAIGGLLVPEWLVRRRAKLKAVSISQGSRQSDEPS